GGEGTMRTAPPKFNADQIPQELREQARWLVWRLINRKVGEKPSKVPHDAHSGRRADNTDERHQSSFTTVLGISHQYGGIGYALGSDFTVVDLDHVRNVETGELTPEARTIVAALGSYTEVSPSGDGVHIWLRGAPALGRKKVGNVEVYNDRRFMTV